MRARSARGCALAVVLAARYSAADEPAPAEVVVTGLKRETLVQQTPLSLSSLPGGVLAKTGIENVSELGRVAPGLTAADSGLSNVRLIMRGVQAVGEPTVGLYYDETAMSGAVGASNDAAGSAPMLRLIDVDRVEILRGPQGTLFGASAMGGAVRVLYRKPEFSYQGSVASSVTVTEHGSPGYEVHGIANVPIVDDLVAARVVLFDERRGGFVDNAPLHQSSVDDRNVWGGRLMLRAQPARHVTLDAVAQHQQTDGQLPIWNPAAGNYVSTAQAQLPSNEVLDRYNGTARWDIDRVSMVATSSYVTRRLDAATADASSFFAADLNNPGACAKIDRSPCSPDALSAFTTHVLGAIPGDIYSSQWSHTASAELRFSSNPQDSRITWTGGAYYSDRETDVDVMERKADASTGALLQPALVQYHRHIDDSLRELAAFGDVAFRVVPEVTVSAGTRVFAYHRSVGGDVSVPFDLIGAAATPYSSSDFNEQGAVSRFSVGYQVSPDLLVYGEAAQGFRPGGVNQVTGLPAALNPYHSDSLWDYETGIKLSGLKNRVFVNFDGYLMSWSNIQVAGSRPDGLFRFISNAGGARFAGVEAEIGTQLVRGLRVNAFGTLARSVLTEDQINDAVVAPGRKGDRIPYAPEYTGGASGQYSWPIVEGVNGMVRTDANVVGPSYSEINGRNPYNRRIDAYALVNVRTGVEGIIGSWDAYAFATNLTGAIAIQYATANSVSVGQTLVTSAPPRTFGLMVQKRFF